MKNIDKILIALGAIVMASTIAILAFLVHWAFGSMMTGLILMCAGAITPFYNEEE